MPDSNPGGSSGPPRAVSTPGPRGVPLLGSLGPFRRDLLGFLSRMALDYGDVCRFKLGPKPIYFVNHPDLVRHILLDNHTGYRKSEGIQRLRPLIGDGLVAVEPPRWRRARRLMQPVFQRARVSTFAPLMASAAHAMAERWVARDGDPFSVRDDAKRLTLSVVGRALFDADLTGSLDTVGHAFTEALDHTMARLQAPLPTPLWVPTPANRRFARARRLVDRTVYSIVSERRRAADAPNDLLAMLMEVRDDGDRLSDAQLRDEITTLLLAGHDTSAYGLTWTLYLLARHPEIEARLADDVRGVVGEGPPSVEHLEQLPLVAQVVCEALRLYPPSWGLARVPLEDDVVGGHRIPAGVMVLMSPYVLHRHPGYWDDPRVFRPSRFSGELAKIPAYLPFGAGPRTCIGQHFATLELQLALAAIINRVRLELLDSNPVPAQAGITLRPGRPVMAVAHPRD